MKDQYKSTHLQIRISEDMKRKFEVLATEKGMTISEYVRYLMLKELGE